MLLKLKMSPGFEERMAENVSNLAKGKNLQIQEAEWTPVGGTQRNSRQDTS